MANKIFIKFEYAGDLDSTYLIVGHSCEKLLTWRPFNLNMDILIVVGLIALGLGLMIVELIL